MNISLKFYFRSLVIYLALIWLLFGTGVISGSSTNYPPEYEQHMTDMAEGGNGFFSIFLSAPLGFVMGLFNWIYLQFITKDYAHSLCFWMNKDYEEPVISSHPSSRGTIPSGEILLGIFFLSLWANAQSEFYVMGRWSHAANAEWWFWEAGDSLIGFAKILISLFGYFSFYKLVKELYGISKYLEFHDDMAGFAIAGRGGYVSRNSKIMIQPRYTGFGNFSEGLCAVRLNKKWGFIDNRDRKVIEFKYDEVDDFKEGIARIRISGKIGDFMEIYGFQKFPDKYGWVDKTGNEYWDMTEDEARQHMQNR
jgi:hypothetical protein